MTLTEKIDANLAWLTKQQHEHIEWMWEHVYKDMTIADLYEYVRLRDEEDEL